MNNVKAIQKLNETELKLKVGSKKSWHDMYSGSAYIFIGGLDYGLTEGDMLSIFSQYGEIMNINLVRDKKSGKTKGFCFLAYENQKSTILAVDNLNGIKVCGRTIRVDHVAEYRRPKDEHGNEIIEKGCAPTMPTPSPTPTPSPPPQSHKHKKKKVKKHKEKEKSKDKKPDSGSEESEERNRMSTEDRATSRRSRERERKPRRRSRSSSISKRKRGYRSRSIEKRDTKFIETGLVAEKKLYRSRSKSKEKRDDRKDHKRLKTLSKRSRSKERISKYGSEYRSHSRSSSVEYRRHEKNNRTHT